MGNEVVDSIQVFCPICARGVLVRNESMYKCPQCQRVVCRPCFDKEHRLCVDCGGSLLPGTPRSARRSHIPALADPEAVPAAPPAASPGRDRTRQGIILFVAGIVALVAVMVLGLFLTIPSWLTGIIAGGSCLSFTLGIVQLLKD